MNIQGMLLAEAVVQDGRGAITAVGINQNLVIAPVIPTQVKRATIAFVAGEPGELTPGDKLSFTISVIKPSGSLASQDIGQVNVGPLLRSDLPPGFNIAAESVFAVTEYGRHTIKVAVQVDEYPEMTAEADFWVVAQADQPDETPQDDGLNYER